MKDMREFLKLVRVNNKRKIIQEHCALSFLESVDMECMKYECSIDTKTKMLDSDSDEISIKISIDPEKSNHSEYEAQDGINISINIPLFNIDSIIPIDVTGLCNEREIDTYFHMTRCKYSYIDKDEDATYSTYNTNSAVLFIENYIDIYGDNRVYWTMASNNTHGFCLSWEDYNEYIKFYSHIINMISNNLGDLLDKYNLLGE